MLNIFPVDPKGHTFCSFRTDDCQRNSLFKKTTYIIHMDVSENGGTPKSSILIGFSIINHSFGGTPIFGNTHIFGYFANQGSEDTSPGIVTSGALDFGEAAMVMGSGNGGPTKR